MAEYARVGLRNSCSGTECRQPAWCDTVSATAQIERAAVVDWDLVSGHLVCEATLRVSVSKSSSRLLKNSLDGKG